jgi:hypothetical protein
MCYKFVILSVLTWIMSLNFLDNMIHYMCYRVLELSIDSSRESRYMIMCISCWTLPKQ